MPYDLEAMLRLSVQAIGGRERAGQLQMAHAVQHAVQAGEHLLVQAGTGTGKSLAYLVPAVLHAFDTGRPVVVSTATLTLQAQIVGRDLPRLAAALEPVLGRAPRYAMVKGRANYLCAHKLEGGFPAEEDALLPVGQVDRSASGLGAEVLRLREWAADTESGDRDELVPGVSARAWRQVSVSARECLGQLCPMVAECFVERSRTLAREVDVLVTNHSFMAIDAFEGRHLLPGHDLLVIDEAHELADRVTSTVAAEILPSTVSLAARKAARLAETGDLDSTAEFFESALEALPEGRLQLLPVALVLSLTRIRDCTRTLQSELKPASPADSNGQRQQARAAVDELYAQTERILQERHLDVVWVGRDQRRGPALHVAPMSVAAALRDKVFQDRTVVLTSATLELGGSFDTIAEALGLLGEQGPRWSGLDVGSPFDYPRQAIAYVASDLPPPGRDGASPESTDRIEQLVRAAGGRTLGLFSSMRAAVAAAEQMRERLADTEIRILLQGEDQTPTLVRQFAADARTCLFGTISLWQGVDVPGPACQLVVIDRIPFPRPDDPLASARTQAIARKGGNGFMAVSATHAALRLAQGSGRLIRRADDQGVVAFLDPRMATARYAGFLQRSLPPFWPTTDTAMICAALRRLDRTAGPVLTVGDPAGRAAAGAVDGALTFEPEVVEPVQHPAPAGIQAVQHPEPERGPDLGTGKGRPWSAEDDEELKDGRDLGLSLDELADHLDIPPEQVAARLRLLETDS